MGTLRRITIALGNSLVSEASNSYIKENKQTKTFENGIFP